MCEGQKLRQWARLIASARSAVDDLPAEGLFLGGQASGSSGGGRLATRAAQALYGMLARAFPSATALSMMSLKRCASTASSEHIWCSKTCTESTVMADERLLRDADGAADIRHDT